VEVDVADETGEPLRGARYFITNGGTRIEGRLDDSGHARIDGIDPATTEIHFPDFEDKNDDDKGGDDG
jgi:hypothetical protein